MPSRKTRKSLSSQSHFQNSKHSTQTKKMNTLKSSVRPADRMTQSFRIVLHPALNKGEWVTHCENVRKASWTEQSPDGYSSKECPDYYHGHYFRDDYCGAVADYKARCEKYGLKP